MYVCAERNQSNIYEHCELYQIAIFISCNIDSCFQIVTNGNSEVKVCESHEHVHPVTVDRPTNQDVKLLDLVQGAAGGQEGGDGVPQEDPLPVEGRPQHGAAGNAGGGGGRLVPEGQALQGEIENSCIKQIPFLSNGMQVSPKCKVLSIGILTRENFQHCIAALNAEKLRLQLNRPIPCSSMLPCSIGH